MARVLVTEPLAEEGLQVLRQNGIDVQIRTDLDAKALRTAIADCDGLLVRSRTRVTAELIAAADHLQVIGRAGSGVDNIDLPAATRRGIAVVNAPNGNTVAVAEHTLGMLLALVRRIPFADAALRHGQWEKSSCEGVQLRGKVLGLLGLGRIGTAVARRALAFEMRVLAYDPFVTPERAAQMGVEWSPLEDLLCASDVVSLHLPETDKTRGLLGSRELALMKPTAYLINCARGGLVDETALLSALQNGHLAGAALDVFAHEPLRDSPLASCERVVLTPHLAASTAEAQADAAREVAQQVLDVLQGRIPRYPVNAAALSTEDLEGVGPYMDLAQRLGSLYAQAGDNHVRAIELACAGEAAQGRTDWILSAALVGLLAGASEETVNWVNAQVLARERGIALAVSSEPARDGSGWSNQVELRVRSRETEHILTGTVLWGEPHVVRMDDFWLDFVPRGMLLVSEHIEQPGIIGRMGTVLGAAGISISFVQVGRHGRGGPGLMVMGLDDPLTPEALQQLMALPSVRSARMVRL